MRKPAGGQAFIYDGKMRRRFRFEAVWTSSKWGTNTTVRYVYDGNLVIQERAANRVPQVTFTRDTDLSGSIQAAGGIGGLLARTDHSTLNCSRILPRSRSRRVQPVRL